MFNSITAFGKETTDQMIYNDNHMSEDNEDDMVSDVKQDIPKFNDDVSKKKMDTTDAIDLDADDANENNNEADNSGDTDDNKIEEKHYGWYFNEQHSGWYYYDQQGNKLFGWQCIGGKWYYLDAKNQEHPGLMLSDCGKKIGNTTYFFDKNGAMLTGWAFRPEGCYYTNKSGAMLTGWQYIGGKWYYLDAENQEYPGLMLADCGKKIGSATYFFGKSGTMLTGWAFRPEGWYYTNKSGAMLTGWQYIGGKWYYLDADNQEYLGLMLKDCMKLLGSTKYFFDKSGAMLTGWALRPEGWYYTNKSGAMLTGWQYIGGKWYYLDADNQEYPGLMLKDCMKPLGSTKYLFDKSGAMLTGWALRPEGWYYTNKSGAMLTGWQQVGSKWYYLEADNQKYPGLMLANCERVIGNKTYYFTSSGAMRSGWYAESGSWYYYDDYTGQIVSGWKKVGNAWYYMDPDNRNKMVANGWKKIGSQWYLFNTNGSMRTNWVLINGLWYYLGSDGAARTGWKVIGGNWYYFYTANDPHGGKECAMARNVSIDGWKLTDSGAMVSSTEMKMLAKAQVYSSNTRYLILVDRAACKVGIYTGKAGAWNQSKFWSCSPGKPSTPTVSGTFTVQGKGYYFDSGKARCFYYTQFKGNYLFHSVLYAQTSTPSRIIDGRLGMQLSHGCVRLDVNNAKWIYDNIPRGTKVVIY